MNNLNSVLVEGKLSDNPKKLDNGKSGCHFIISSERTYKTDEECQIETTECEIEAWGKLADTCLDHLQKGRGVRVVGRLKQEISELNGAMYSRLKVLAEHVEFKPLMITDKK